MKRCRWQSSHTTLCLPFVYLKMHFSKKQQHNRTHLTLHSWRQWQFVSHCSQKGCLHLQLGVKLWHRTLKTDPKWLETQASKAWGTSLAFPRKHSGYLTGNWWIVTWYLFATLSTTKVTPRQTRFVALRGKITPPPKLLCVFSHTNMTVSNSHFVVLWFGY